MTPEAGKKHITRDGQVVGPVHLYFGKVFHYWTDGTHRWLFDGRYDTDTETPMDLIAVAPGQSEFVRETAARIMASDYWRIERDDENMAKAAVCAAIALEKALQEAVK